MPEPTANSPEPEAKHSPGWGRYAIWAVGIVIVYVLSSGPALKLNSKKILSDKAMIIYEPLFSIYFYKPINKTLGMYWRLWLPTEFGGDLTHDQTVEPKTSSFE